MVMTMMTMTMTMICYCLYTLPTDRWLADRTDADATVFNGKSWLL